MTASILITILIIIILLAVGGSLVALLVYGIGWLIHLVTKFDLFQSTLLGLASMFAFGFLAERAFSAILSANRNDLDDDEFYDDDFDDDFGKEEEKSNAYPGIPRWRQPLKQVDFSKARPNDLCPCGSGRKFKNCHGAKRPTT
ncbi:MAG: hypothetical protein Fur0043_07020 [Anaerolineales bacterium]